MGSVMIGIVSYNPEVKRILNTVNELKRYQECDIHFIIVDNGSVNRGDVSNLEKQVANLEVVLLEKNEGIATGLNIVMEYAKQRNCEFVLTLDQDSELKADSFHKMCSCMEGCADDVAAVCPLIQERGCKKKGKASGDIEYVSWCITAGMLIRTDVWEKIGKYDEKMFIDLVDVEFCARLNLGGYKICRANEAVLINEIGDSVKEVKIGSRCIVVRNHVPIRYYYYTRNLIYCRKKIPEYFKWKIIGGMYVTWFLKLLLFEEKKKEKLLETMRGIKAGISDSMCEN